MEGFELYLFSFRLFNFDLCSLLARILVACELLLGLGLISGIDRRLVNWLCAAMLGGFSVFLLWRLALGDQESCHCFGDILDMNPWQSLLKNAALGALLAVAWKAPARDAADLLSNLVTSLRRRALRSSADSVTPSAAVSDVHHLRPAVVRLVATIVVAVATFAVVFATNPPSFYFRMVKHDTNLSAQEWRPFSDEFGLSEGKQVVLFLSPLCEHCQHCAAKMQTIIERHDLDSSRIHMVFMTVTDKIEDMDTLIPYFFDQAGMDDPGYDRHIITYDLFIPMTDGMMPLVCLFDSASLVREYTYSTLDESALVSFLSE